MHTQHCHATVDNLHSVKRRNISDGSASAKINLSKLCCLESNIVIIKNPANSCNVLCIGIVGTGFSSCPGELVKNNTASKICCILFLKSLTIGWIIAGTYI